MKAKTVRLAAAILMAAVVTFSCNKQDPDPQPAPEEPVDLDITRFGTSNYYIVYGSDKTSADALSSLIAGKTSVSLEVVSGKSSAVRLCEILVGASGRDEHKAALALLGGKDGYCILTSGHKLVIAGSNDSWTALGVKAVADRIKDEGAWRNGDRITVPKNTEIVEAKEDPQLLAYLLANGLPFDLKTAPVLNCYGKDGIDVSQGAASDGKYFYILNRSSDDKRAIVYKYDIATRKSAGQSEVFNAGHANDMTYDDANSRLIIAHGQSEGKILTPVDAATLKPGSNINITVGSGAITYNASRASYAISQGGKSLYITDGNFKVTKSATRTDSTGFTAQGMGSDDSYIYFPMSGGTNGNKIVVYGWDCKLVTVLSISDTIESESMFYAAGKYYVSFYPGSHAGATLLELRPEYRYKN